MKKILFITHQLTRTGAPYVLFDMIRCCKRIGHAIAVISLSDGNARSDWENEGISVTVMPGLSYVGDKMVSIMNRFDVIVVNTLVCCDVIPLCVASGTDTIWWIHEHENYFSYYKDLLPEWNKIEGKVRVYGVSPTTQQLLVSMAGYKNAEILPFCVTDRKDIEKNNKTKLDTVRFVCAGLFSYDKGQDILCNAIQKLPPEILKKCVFYFYGDRTEVDYDVYSPVEKLAGSMEFVECHDSVEHDDMLRIISDMDYVIVPSRKESMSAMAIEGMMLGTPCVISDKCGVTYYLKDKEDSLIFQACNADSLADSICHAVGMAFTEQYDFVAERARMVYDREFSEDIFSNRISRLI